MTIRPTIVLILATFMTIPTVTSAEGSVTADALTLDDQSNSVFFSRPTFSDSSGFEVRAGNAWQPITDSDVSAIISLENNVEIRSGDGLTLRTSSATYYPELSSVSANSFSVEGR